MKDLKLIDKHLSKDKSFKAIVDKLEPLQLEQSSNVYHELVKNIAYQQISYKAADTIYARFIRLMGKLDYLPEDILATSFDTLKSVGFSRQKTQYIFCISEYFKSHELMDCNWESMDDKEIIKTLTEIKGVGVWTAKMILIFQLHRPDVFPHEDLAIRQVIKEVYNIQEEKRAFTKAAEKIAEKWKPYRTIASLYLWSYKRAQLTDSL